MKKIILLISLFSLVASAQTTPPNPALFTSLKAAMKDMSSKLKTIAKQVSDPKMNGSSEKLSHDLVISVTEARRFIPSGVSDQARRDLYLKMMDETAALSQDLEQAFHKNDNANAKILLDKLSLQKKDGHKEFN